MRRWKLVSVCVAVAMLSALAVIRVNRTDGPPRLIVTDTVADDVATIHIDQLTATYERETGRVEPASTAWIAWLMKHSSLVARFWSRTHKVYQRAPEGAIYIMMQATIVPHGGQAIRQADLEYRLDYGRYTIGTGNTQWRVDSDHPPSVGAQFMVTDGPMPQALEVKVNGKWLRFPILVKR